jgi:hypothetical protein
MRLSLQVWDGVVMGRLGVGEKLGSKESKNRRVEESSTLRL